MSKVGIFVVVAISIISGALSGYFFSQRALKQMDYPIAVVDWKSYIDAAIVDSDGRLHSDKVDEGMKTAQMVASNLSSQGYVVIESQSVMAAPEFYYVRAENKDAEKDEQESK
jgi:predicted P-loop ATPase/GTPase